MRQPCGKEHLGIADYALLARKNYPQLSEYTPLLQKPGFWHGLFCFTMDPGSSWLDSVNRYCQDYYRYKNVDTSRSTSLGSLLELEKYLIEHANAYVSLNTYCKERALTMAVLSIPVANIGESWIPITKVTLRLCQPLEKEDI